MITNFESETATLSNEELAMVPRFIRGFMNHGIDNPIKAQEIIEAYKKQGIKLADSRIRKITNYIRSNSLLPLIATSNGYYVSNDPAVIRKQIQSLEERGSAIINSAKGLYKFLNVG